MEFFKLLLLFLFFLSPEYEKAYFDFNYLALVSYDERNFLNTCAKFS